LEVAGQPVEESAAIALLLDNVEANKRKWVREVWEKR
jgi:hypothetical protein